MLALQHGATEASPLDHSGLCLLSLDGGGVRGLSTLYILKGLMSQLNYERQKANLPRLKPCELFDIIGGTSTGGLIAIMLGRLEMDVDECIAAYIELMKTVFEKKSRIPFSLKGKTKARFDSVKLKGAVEKVVTDHKALTTTLFNDGTNRACKVFVCSIAHETKEIVRLRSYSLPDEHEPGTPPTICQAALATSAATSFFDPIDIGARRYADGGLGANNPVDEMEGEASNIWCADTGDLKPLVKCFISIGTGNPGKKVMEDNILAFLSKTLVGIATQTEETEKRFVAKWRQHYDQQRYFRYNVDQGLQDIGLAEYKQQGAIEAATNGYMNHQAQKFRTRDCVSNLKQKQNKTENSFAAMMHELNVLPSLGRQHVAREASWDVPFERNPHFVGRDSILKQLETLLSVHGQTGKAALYGLGGVGKTQIALEVAHRAREKDGDCSVLWVPATTPEKFQQSYFRIGQRLGIPGVDANERDVKKLVQEHLSQEKAGRWLLIMDNADDADMWLGSLGSETKDGLAYFLPKSSQGSILFTTRSRKIAVDLAHQNIIEVSEMDSETATQMLSTSLADKSLLQDYDDFIELLKQLTFLPLGIAQAAAYINKNGIILAEYLSLLQEQEESVIEILSEDFEDEGRYRDGKNAVATTWLISFTQIRRDNPLAFEYLSMMSCIDSKAIPLSFLPVGKSPKAKVDAIGTLTAYSFVSKQSADQSLDLHRLVHLATRNWLKNESSMIELEARAVKQLRQFLPSDDHSQSLRISRAYLPHAEFILDYSRTAMTTGSGLALGHRVGTCLVRDGRYNEAERLLSRVLEEREKMLGLENQLTLRTLSYFGYLLLRQGKYAEAEVRIRQVLEAQTKVLGPEDKATLTSFDDLGKVLELQGKLEEAQAIYQRTLEVREKVFGLKHPVILDSLERIGNLLRKQGKHNEAEEMARKTLEGLGEAYGAGSIHTLNSMTNLAKVLIERHKYEEAEELLQGVLKGCERLEGPENQRTLTNIALLAFLFHRQKNYSAASECYQQACGGLSKILGAHHPRTLSCYRNYNRLLKEMDSQ